MLGYATALALLVSSVSAATGTTARAAATNNNQGFTTKFATPTNDPYYAGTATRYVTATATKIKSKSTCLKNCNGKRGWSKNGIILFVFRTFVHPDTLLDCSTNLARYSGNFWGYYLAGSLAEATRPETKS
jgi:hypothetical protein